jgi:hypothetical protein
MRVWAGREYGSSIFSVLASWLGNSLFLYWFQEQLVTLATYSSTIFRLSNAKGGHGRLEFLVGGWYGSAVGLGLRAFTFVGRMVILRVNRLDIDGATMRDSPSWRTGISACCPKGAGTIVCVLEPFFEI